ncbi:MAG: hypothetical protein U0441_37440 [Polyangiaceae bacterium]
MNRRSLILALALAVSATACGPKKQPVTPPPDTETTAEPEPPKPPPPPKCESLDEKCESKGGKKVKVPGSNLVFEPVLGWRYAHGDKFAVAQAGEEDACMGLVGYDAPDAKDAKKTEAARQAQVEALAAELKINLLKTKVAWKKPDKNNDGKVPLLLWTIEQDKEVVRGAKKGQLLVVATNPSDGKAVLGIAFVPSDDDKSGAKIVPSFNTLAAGEAP